MDQPVKLLKRKTQYVVSRYNLNSTLCEHTLELLRSRSRLLTHKQIERDTKIPVGWLALFTTGKIHNPGVRQIQTLYEYLSKKKIEF